MKDEGQNIKHEQLLDSISVGMCGESLSRAGTYGPYGRWCALSDRALGDCTNCPGQARKQ